MSFNFHFSAQSYQNIPHEGGIAQLSVFSFQTIGLKFPACLIGSRKVYLLLWHILFIIFYVDLTSTIESEASFISVCRFTDKRHSFEQCVFQRKSAPWTSLYILSLDCIQFIQLKVCIHMGFLCVKGDGSFSSMCLRGTEEWNVYSCTQCWHLKRRENRIV